MLAINNLYTTTEIHKQDWFLLIALHRISVYSAAYKEVSLVLLMCKYFRERYEYENSDWCKEVLLKSLYMCASRKVILAFQSEFVETLTGNTVIWTVSVLPNTCFIAEWHILVKHSLTVKTPFFLIGVPCLDTGCFFRLPSVLYHICCWHFHFSWGLSIPWLWFMKLFHSCLDLPSRYFSFSSLLPAVKLVSLHFLIKHDNTLL